MVNVAEERLRALTWTITEMEHLIRCTDDSGGRLQGLFGVKFSILRDHATWNALYSVDSGAWDYAARWRKCKEGGNKGDLSLKEAEKYQQKIEYLREFHRGQGILNFV